MLAGKLTLAELLSDALVNGFSDDVIKTSALKSAIYFMYINEIITKETYLKLLSFTPNACWYPVTYYEDGSIKYVFAKELANKSDINKAYTKKYNPQKVLTWIVDTLKKDEFIHDYLSLDSYQDLLLSAKDIPMSPNFIGIEKKADELGLDVVLYKDVLFYFVRNEKSHSLYYKTFAQIEPFWLPSLGTRLREGMSGELIHVGNDFYARFNNVAAYFHFNVESGLQEVIQNVLILDYCKSGELLYRDVCEEKLYFQNRNGKTKMLGEYEADKKYSLKGNYVLVTSKFSLEIPTRLYINGCKENASDVEKAKAFWDYFLDSVMTIDVSVELKDEMIRAELRDMMEHSKLSLENMQKVVVFLAENKLCDKEDVIPFANILEQIESIGVDKHADISDEIYTLAYYQALIVDENYDVFPDSYSRIVCELAKEEDFWRCLQRMPEVLFARHIKNFDDKDNKSIRTYEREMNVGVFDVVNGQLQAIISPINCGGKVVGNQVVYEHSTEDWRGRFCYDLVMDKFIASWPTTDIELLNEVCKRFKVNNTLVCYDFYEEEQSEENDWEDDIDDEEDDARDVLIAEVESLIEEIGDVFPFS